ncbi:MAG: hypothetical protein ACI89L_001444 [Phycisphaerales bacterium]|jgi:hypothetical protein
MNTTPTTEQRLARLETQSRRWRLAAVGLAGLVVGGLVVGFGPGDKYRGDFDLIDEEFLDYLEAGGVFPVPRVVGVAAENDQYGNGFVFRVWSDGTTEAITHTSVHSSQDAQGNTIFTNKVGQPQGYWQPFIESE